MRLFFIMFGIKNNRFNRREGRKIIGKAVITTLYPGEELSSLDSAGLLIKNIAAMSIVAPVKQNEHIQKSDTSLKTTTQNSGI